MSCRRVSNFCFPDVSLTYDFEQDTLPLLFSDAAECDAYHDALATQVFHDLGVTDAAKLQHAMALADAGESAQTSVVKAKKKSSVSAPSASVAGGGGKPVAGAPAPPAVEERLPVGFVRTRRILREAREAAAQARAAYGAAEFDAALSALERGVTLRGELFDADDYQNVAALVHAAYSAIHLGAAAAIAAPLQAHAVFSRAATLVRSVFAAARRQRTAQKAELTHMHTEELQARIKRRRRIEREAAAAKRAEMLQKGTVSPSGSGTATPSPTAHATAAEANTASGAAASAEDAAAVALSSKRPRGSSISFSLQEHVGTDVSDDDSVAESPGKCAPPSPQGLDVAAHRLAMLLHHHTATYWARRRKWRAAARECEMALSAARKCCLLDDGEAPAPIPADGAATEQQPKPQPATMTGGAFLLHILRVRCRIANLAAGRVVDREAFSGHGHLVEPTPATAASGTITPTLRLRGVVGRPLPVAALMDEISPEKLVRGDLRAAFEELLVLRPPECKSGDAELDYTHDELVITVTDPKASLSTFSGTHDAIQQPPNTPSQQPTEKENPFLIPGQAMWLSPTIAVTVTAHTAREASYIAAYFAARNTSTAGNSSSATNAASAVGRQGPSSGSSMRRRLSHVPAAGPRPRFDGPITLTASTLCASDPALDAEMCIAPAVAAAAAAGLGALSLMRGEMDACALWVRRARGVLCPAQQRLRDDQERKDRQDREAACTVSAAPSPAADMQPTSARGEALGACCAPVVPVTAAEGKRRQEAVSTWARFIDAIAESRADAMRSREFDPTAQRSVVQKDRRAMAVQRVVREVLLARRCEQEAPAMGATAPNSAPIDPTRNRVNAFSTAARSQAAIRSVALHFAATHGLVRGGGGAASKGRAAVLDGASTERPAAAAVAEFLGTLDPDHEDRLALTASRNGSAVSALTQRRKELRAAHGRADKPAAPRAGGSAAIAPPHVDVAPHAQPRGTDDSIMNDSHDAVPARFVFQSEDDAGAGSGPAGSGGEDASVIQAAPGDASTVLLDVTVEEAARRMTNGDIRAVMARLEAGSHAYREYVRVLARREARARQRREDLALAGLLSRAADVAKRAKMTAQWEALQARMQDPNRAATP